MKRVFVPAFWALLSGAAWAADTSPRAPGELTVTEFMTEPENGIPMYYGEWFEIYNGSGRDLDLDGLEVEGSSGMDSGFTITETLYIAAGDYLVLGVNNDTELNGNVDIDYEYDRSSGGTSRFDLDRTGDTIQLIYDGVIIDTVTWSSAAWDVTQQYSHQVNINAFDNEWANDLSHNWCHSSPETLQDAGWYGTPGEANSLCRASESDDDGDGYTEVEGDCDDDDAYVNPDAIDGAEDSFGVSNDDADCDGVRDDGAVDDDGDGYAETDGDCDDENSSSHPGAEETPYDGLDNDCDETTPDDDLDGDGFLLADDCDDVDASVHADAEEVPYDDKDNDCDGFDACDVDEDGHWADPDHCMDGSDCCRDEDQNPGEDCDDGNANINPDMTEGDPDNGGSADGLDNDCSGEVDEPYLSSDTGSSDTANNGDADSTSNSETQQGGCLLLSPVSAGFILPLGFLYGRRRRIS